MNVRHAIRQAAKGWWFRPGITTGLISAVFLALGCSPVASQAQSLSARRPEQAVKLVFVHHSCGENWLAD